MATAQENEAAGVAETITDFETLFVRHAGGNEFRVLNLGEETVSIVDIDEVTCNCEDNNYRRDGEREVCKHLQKALFQAPEARVSIKETAPFYLSQSIERAQEAAETVEAAVDSLDEALVTAREYPAEAAAGGPDEAATEAADQLTVDDVEEWFSTGYAAPDLVEIRSGEHNGQHGVVLEPDSGSMNEGQKETFKSLIKTLEDSNCHAGFLDDGCGECGASDDEYWWFVPQADSSEVWS